MCKVTPPQRNKLPPRMLLSSVESFSENDNKLPNNTSLFVTISFWIGLLIISERIFRYMIDSIKHWHPVLDDETNRHILARHLGVDAMGCFITAYLGWKARSVMKELIDVCLGYTSKMTPAYENRMFQYNPEAARICVFFMSYQLKNFYDTIIWNDGLLFIFHHVLTLGTIYGSLWPGTAQFYAPFYFGFSELSTGVLCMLANFDDEHGVVGLADAFPMGKVVLGGLFAVSFLLCRVVLWSAVSYYFVKDAWNAIQAAKAISNDDKKKNDSTSTTQTNQFAGHMPWVKYFMVSLSSLSVLQVIWLFEIFRIAYVELNNMGFL